MFTLSDTYAVVEIHWPLHLTKVFTDRELKEEAKRFSRARTSLLSISLSFH